jgi:hypothetical protein
MLTGLNKRLLVVWLGLSALTLAYIAIDSAARKHGAATASTAVTVSAIIIALVKVRFIMREFMEVRHAPTLLCRLTDLWIALMAGSMLGLYVAGKAA